MKDRREEIYSALKKRGLSSQQQKVIAAEMHDASAHRVPGDSLESEDGSGKFSGPVPETIYRYYDLIHLQEIGRASCRERV